MLRVPSSPEVPASWVRTCASACSPTGPRCLRWTTSSPVRPATSQHLLGRPGFRLLKADVTEYVHVPGPVDQVLHFASPASPIDYLMLPIETLKVGSIGTLHALGLAKEKGARFLLASTSETYGDPQVHPQPETYWGHVNPVGPRGVYDEAKRYAEALTMAYRRTHDVDTAIVRIFNTHGPRMRPNDGRAIPAFASQALDRQADHGGGRRLADPVDHLRRRPGGGDHALAAQRPGRAGQHRQPARDVGAAHRRDHQAPRRQRQRDRLRAPARRTTRASASPTSRWLGGSWAGSRRSASTKACGRTIDWFRAHPGPL